MCELRYETAESNTRGGKGTLNRVFYIRLSVHLLRRLLPHHRRRLLVHLLLHRQLLHHLRRLLGHHLLLLYRLLLLEPMVLLP